MLKQKIIISEKNIRKLIREEVEKSKNSIDDNYNQADQNKILKLAKSKVLYMSGDQLYIKPDKVVKERFATFRKELQVFLGERWQHSDVKIGYGGIARGMEKALTGGGARQAGTKHGSGLALDTKILIGLPGEKSTKTVTKRKKSKEISLVASSSSLGIKSGMSQDRLRKELLDDIEKAKINTSDANKALKSDRPAEDILKDLGIENPLEKYSKIIDTPTEKNEFLKQLSDYEKQNSKVLMPMLKWSLGRNKALSKNAELVKLIHEFMQLPKNKDILWGGYFSESIPGEGIVKEKGILEFHHFEYKTEPGKAILLNKNNPVNKIVSYFGPKLGITVEKMCSNSPASKQARGKLYSKLLQFKNLIINSSAKSRALAKK